MANYQDVKTSYEKLEWEIGSLIAEAHHSGLHLYQFAGPERIADWAERSFELFKEAEDLDPTLQTEALFNHVSRLHCCIIIDACNAFLYQADPEAEVERFAKYNG